MASISDLHNPWRDSLRPAKFRDARFEVDVSAVASGRRIVMHEYPKRDKPYAEDMGRRARKYPVTAYLIGPDYKDRRDLLKTALEKEGPGTLVLPWYVEDIDAVCEQYSINESRERGGYCAIEMMFAEAGEPGFAQTGTNTAAAIEQAAGTATTQTVDSLNKGDVTIGDLVIQ